MFVATFIGIVILLIVSSVIACVVLGSKAEERAREEQERLRIKYIEERDAQRKRDIGRTNPRPTKFGYNIGSTHVKPSAPTK